MSRDICFGHYPRGLSTKIIKRKNFEGVTRKKEKKEKKENKKREKGRRKGNRNTIE